MAKYLGGSPSDYLPKPEPPAPPPPPQAVSAPSSVGIDPSFSDLPLAEQDLTDLIPSKAGLKGLFALGATLGKGFGKEGIIIAEKQFSKKVGKHASDFGFDPSNASDREAFRSLIVNIGNAPDKVVSGTFRGQPGGVKFVIRGTDVVVTSPSNEFITILRDGINNPAVQRALGR